MVIIVEINWVRNVKEDWSFPCTMLNLCKYSLIETKSLMFCHFDSPSDLSMEPALIGVSDSISQIELT